MEKPDMNPPHSTARELAEKYADMFWDRKFGSYPNMEWLRDVNTYLAGFKAGVERAAGVASDEMTNWEQGILEAVNSGDATMAEIYPELRMHQKLDSAIQKRIGALLEDT